MPSFARPRPGLFVLLAAVCLSACASTTSIGSPPYEQGSGRLVTETRSLGAFHGLQASQGVSVFLSTGSTASASVSADDNLLDNVTTEVRDGTLFVGVAGSIQTTRGLKVTVTTSTAIDAIVAGAGATVDTEDLAGDRLTAHVSSGASLRAGGRTAELDVTVVAGSTADLRNVESATARVRVSAGSTAWINSGGVVSGGCDTGSTLHVRGGAVTPDLASDSTCSIKRD